MLVAVPGAKAQGGLEPGPGYLLSIYSIGTAFGWFLMYGNDPPATVVDASTQPVASRITTFGMPPPLLSAPGGIVPKAPAGYGALAPIAGAQNPTCSHSDALAIHPSGTYVYFGGGIGSPGLLCGYAVDPATGAFSPVAGPPVATAPLPSAIAIDPAGTFMYVAGAAGNNIWGYAIDAKTGTPSPIGGFPVASGGSGLSAVVIDRSGRYAYVANRTGKGSAGSISAFAVNRVTGAWTPVAGSPFEMDPVFNDSARSLALTPDGRFLFVGGTVGIHTYAINAANGALKLLAQRDSMFPADLAVDPTGRFLYAPDYDKYLVRGFAIATDGSLTPVGTQPYGSPNPAGSRGIAIVGDLVYVTNTNARTIYGFRIQPATGALSPVAGSPYATDARSFAVAGQGFLGATLQVDAGETLVAPLGAYGGQPPYVFSIAGGTLPPGLSLNNASGVIAGTAAANGAYAFTAQVTDSAGASASHAKTIFVTGSTTGVPVTVVEFYNAALDHFFITYVADEIAKLDNGTFKGWARTGLSFNAYATAQSGTSAVCRIYIPPGKGDGHFFGRDASECAGTIGKNPTFVLESSAFLFLHPATLGACGAGQAPVYRVFSNRADANHRYTTSRAVRDQMVAKGWLAEGDGADIVVMCAPS